MKTLNLNILTTVNILFYSRIIISLICGAMLMYFFSGGDFKANNTFDGIIMMGLILIAAICGLYGITIMKKILVPLSKYPLVLNLLCNINGLGKPDYYGSLKFDLNNIIKDNKLHLTLYYINNNQYPILQFDNNKIIYYTQEYDWTTFKWSYKIVPQGRNEKQVLEFEGINQNNIKIKDNIDFEKINARENEVLLLFVIHDLLFGKRSSFYY
ncbi:hypothetical protein J3D55_000715 [Chryseobacterium ginsenosidimutans]|uniref:hypothetical protein n=1 Tax=Chryseobacterium ginsenosidimutans TaxID=687846 RepID=UPI002169AB63|nr:hypothetical protein [Chryseobacterium ginsenosidimutans]MCS3867799.1 hypothetical protein [Chryseobacterium ginsenosidimutans]